LYFRSNAEHIPGILWYLQWSIDVTSESEVGKIQLRSSAEKFNPTYLLLGGNNTPSYGAVTVVIRLAIGALPACDGHTNTYKHSVYHTKLAKRRAVKNVRLTVLENKHSIVPF